MWGLASFYRGSTQSLMKSSVLVACLYPVNDYFRSKVDSAAVAALATTLTVTPVGLPW